MKPDRIVHLSWNLNKEIKRVYSQMLAVVEQTWKENSTEECKESHTVHSSSWEESVSLEFPNLIDKFPAPVLAPDPRIGKVRTKLRQTIKITKFFTSIVPRINLARTVLRFHCICSSTSASNQLPTTKTPWNSTPCHPMRTRTDDFIHPRDANRSHSSKLSQRQKFRKTSREREKKGNNNKRSADSFRLPLRADATWLGWWKQEAGDGESDGPRVWCSGGDGEAEEEEEAKIWELFEFLAAGVWTGEPRTCGGDGIIERGFAATSRSTHFLQGVYLTCAPDIAEPEFSSCRTEIGL